MERQGAEVGVRAEQDVAATARARAASKADAAMRSEMTAYGVDAPEPVVAVLLSRERVRVQACAGESPRDAFSRVLQRCRGDFNLISRGCPVDSRMQLFCAEAVRLHRRLRLTNCERGWC
jgi:hypothetical protein